MNITELRTAYNEAVQRMNDAAQAFEDLPDDGGDDDGEEAIATAERAFTDAKAEVERRKANLQRLEQIQEARDANPVIETPIGEPAIQTNTLGPHVKVTKEESAYRPDLINRGVSFFADQLLRTKGDRDAADRLERNRREAMDFHGYEERDMQNLSTQGSDFVPPLYLSDLWVGPLMAGRPFADVLPKMPLPPTGTTITIPQLASGVAVAARADAGAVQETDGVTATLTHYVNEIAGQVDIGRIAVMRSDPGLDGLIGNTLIRRYNTKLDTYLFSGNGTPPQHDGLDNVASANTTAYTDSDPTVAELMPKIYEAISEIDTNRLEERADLIVMHGRRASWIANGRASTSPVIQVGAFPNASGAQSGGFTDSFAGLPVLIDNNILTTYGASTNEDQIYILARNDFILMEGPLFSRVFEDVGSGNGLIRYQVFGFSAFLSNRYPQGLSIISGTGLVAPTFNGS